MGAKMLKKQMEKDLAKAKAKEEARSKNKTTGNQGEFLDRGKQKFNMTAAVLQGDDDFKEIDEKKDKNPAFTKAFKALSKRDKDCFLTMNEAFIYQPGDSDSGDEEQSAIHEMIHRANTETKTLFRGVASSIASARDDERHDSMASSFTYDGVETDRGELLDKGPTSGEDGGQGGEKLDADV